MTWIYYWETVVEQSVGDRINIRMLGCAADGEEKKENP